jgi:choline dehydrogenase-like flavoprotein
MRWLSNDVEQLIAACQSASTPYCPDVLVIGSGYGGSVAALRFAEHGLAVALLERGGEYLAGDFPTDLSQTGAFIRAESSAIGGANAVGNEDALFDFRLGTRATALVGNGLGGGSLINAAVALRPDARVFEQPQWPSAIRHSNLDADFQRAYAGLEVQSPQAQAASPHCVPQQTKKYQRLHDIGQTAAQQLASAELSVSTEDVPLAIEFSAEPSQALGLRGSCIGCGNCVSGCNQQAKLSLDKTYLPRARQAGAELFSHVSVLYIEHTDSTPERPWRVHCVRTSERAQWQALHENGRPELAEYEFVIPCGRVIVAAGTFGSSEILLRSQAMGLDIASAWLGQGISANGDDLCAAYDLPNDANGIGQSSVSEANNNAACGPTISAVIRFHDHNDHRRSTIIEDGAIPGLLAPLANELLSTLGILPQLARFGLRGKRGSDPLAVQPEVIARSLALLGMGHDSAAGVATLASPSARLNWSWPANAADPAPHLHRQRMRSIKSLGAEFLPNPASGLLPDEIAQVLSGPAPEAGWITVHPLGGCRMADCVQDGVVNHQGQVFRRDGSLFSSLQVLDGSIMPSSLGVNPLLSITALAERACRLTIAELGASQPTPAQALPPYPATEPAFARSATPVCGAVLAEVLRGPLHWQDSPQAEAHSVAGALFLQMQVADWQTLWKDPEHRVEAIAYSPQTLSFTSSRLVIDRPGQPQLELPVSAGTVQLFRPLADTPWARGSRLLRAALTYLINRWWPDRSRAKAPNAPGLLANISNGARLLWHASAARSFDYQLQLGDGQQGYRLTGSKLIQPAASWRELGQWLRTKHRAGGWPVLPRRSVWEQLTELDVQLWRDDSPHPLASGRLAMDFPEMLRRIAPQLHSGPDSLHALAALASYPLLISRYLISSRILDFRLPDYAPNLPASDPALAADNGQFELQQSFYPTLELPDGGKIAPQAPICLHVPLHADAPKGEQIRVGLVRYGQPQVASQLVNGQRRYQSIMLLNGFAQNTLPFVAEELGSRSLAAMLHAQGWDVWLLEYRVSPFLRASAQFSSMDDIAAGEIPKAIDYILEQLSATAGDALPVPGEMFCFSHCVGSASLGMSLLGGQLTHEGGRAKLAGVLFSQFQPFVIGSKTAQMRLQVAALLVNGLQLKHLEFAAGTVQADALHALMDRLFASFDYSEAERCPGEHDLRHEHPDSTSCKRMAGALSRLFRHDQLLPITHAKLDQYFGRTNLGVFMHGAKCVEYERLVNANGQNVYTSEENLRAFLPMPIMLLHGADNVLFDQESCVESWRQLRRGFSAERLARGYDQQLIAAEHAHFDCTIGKQAPEKIFGEVVGFFNTAYAAPAHAAEPASHNRLRARLPRTGPIVGWCRNEGETSRLRLWIEVDNSQSGAPVAAMTLLSAGPNRRLVHAWPLQQQALDVALGGPLAVSSDAGISYALADIQVPNSWLATLSIAMVSLHRYAASEPAHAQPCNLHWPAEWGQPMSAAEAQVAGGRTPAQHDHPSIPAACALAPSDSHNDSDTHAPTPAAHLSRAPDPANIQPLPLQLSLADAQALLHPLSISLQQARLLAKQAQPGTLSRQRRSLRWMRECVVRLRPEQWQPANSFSFLAASCRHPGLSVMEDSRSDASLLAIGQRQRQQPAAFMLMLGDQIYADARAGLLDSSSALERILPRYREAFGSPGFAAVARSTPLYMAMDDHELGDNWSRDLLLRGQPEQTLSRNALAAYHAFQRAHGPAAQGPDGHDGSWQMADIGFFSLNTRIHRQRAQRRLLDAAQWPLLEHWLLAQQARGAQPKFILSGSVLAPGVREYAGLNAPREADNWQLASAERARLLSFIRDNAISNVVFISGDYHCCAAATIHFEGSPIVAYALVAPPLHAPLWFANVAASSVLRDELIALPDGHASVKAQAWQGDGWLECQLEQQGPTYQMRAVFRCLALDSQELQHQQVDWRFV